MKIQSYLFAAICLSYALVSHARISKYIQFYDDTNTPLTIKHCKALRDDVNFSHQLEGESLDVKGMSDWEHLHNNSVVFIKGVGIECSFTGLDGDDQTLESSIQILFNADGDLEVPSYWGTHDNQWSVNYSSQGNDRYVISIVSKEVQ